MDGDEASDVFKNGVLSTASSSNAIVPAASPWSQQPSCSGISFIERGKKTIDASDRNAHVVDAEMLKHLSPARLGAHRPKTFSGLRSKRRIRNAQDREHAKLWGGDAGTMGWGGSVIDRKP
jgi:hypothetical protein